MQRLLLGCVLASIFAFAINAVASADTQSLTIDPKASLSGSKTAVTVTGTIVCDAGDTGSVTVIVQQSSGKTDAVGTGTTGDFSCTGQVQNWSAVVNVLLGTNFKNGPALALFGASTTPSGGGSPSSSPLQNAGIHIQ
jgi:hypothetical protein